MLPNDRTDYIVVDARFETSWIRYKETIEISSALVSPDTAHTLVNAIQTVEFSSDYYLCPEASPSEISEVGFELKGWLKSPADCSGFDDKDPFCNEVRPIVMRPGEFVTNSLGLTVDCI